MFKKDNKPELYEILKLHRSKLGKSSSTVKEEIVSQPISIPSPPAQEVSGWRAGDSQPIPYNTTLSTAAQPYRKFKIPYKTKEPPPADRTSRYQPQERKLPVKQIILFLLIIGVIVIVYLIGQSRSTQPVISSESSNITTPTTHSSSHLWSNRVIYYKDDAEGQRSAEKILRFLNGKGISGVFTTKEKFQGATCIAICIGKFTSPEEAKKEHSKLKQLHYTFKNVDVAEVK